MESTSLSLALVDWIDICDLLHKVWPHLCEFEKNGNAAKFLWVTKKTCKKRAKRVDLVPKMDFLDAFYPHICYLTYSIPPHIRHGLPRTVLRISRLGVRASPGALADARQGTIYRDLKVVGRHQPSDCSFWANKTEKAWNLFLNEWCLIDFFNPKNADKEKIRIQRNQNKEKLTLFLLEVKIKETYFGDSHGRNQ